MKIIRNIKLLQDCISKYKIQGGDIGFVPTMGALHAGHLSLLQQSILENDLSLNGDHIHGNVYGRGLYFTNRIEYAAGYSTDTPMKKYILMYQVHVGDVIVGNRKMVRLPKSSDDSKPYDSAVNVLSNPYVFVKFKNFPMLFCCFACTAHLCAIWYVLPCPYQLYIMSGRIK